MSDDELDQIRKRKLLSMQNRRMSDEQRQAQAEQQIEQQKQALLSKILAPDARQRLNNLKMVKRDFTENIELQIHWAGGVHTALQVRKNRPGRNGKATERSGLP